MIAYTLKFVYLTSWTHEWYQQTERGSECFISSGGGAVNPANKILLTDINEAYRYRQLLRDSLPTEKKPGHYYTVEEV